VDALGVLGDKRALKPLMDILKEDDYILRACTVTSLGKLGDNMAVKALLNSLEDENYFVRVNAANALATIGDEDSLPALQEALDNSNGESREFEMAVRKAMNEIIARKKKKV
jgi:HEAT repeat protein